MKNTDDLMGFLEPNQFDNIPIENTQLSEDEINRIYSLTMENINCKAKPIKKRMSKKVIISLIAAIIVVSSLTVFAAGSSVGYLFNKQMNAKSDSEIEYLKKSTKETIAFSGGVDYSVEAKAVLSDQNTAQIYFDVVANEGYDINQINTFGKVSLNTIDENGNEVSELSNSDFCVYKQETTSPDRNRQSYIMTIQNEKSLKKCTFLIKLHSLAKETHNKMPPVHINIQKLLNEIGEIPESACQENNVIQNNPLGAPPPKRIIPNKNLNIQLSPAYPDNTLESIGIVDNELQIIYKHPNNSTPPFNTKNRLPILDLVNTKDNFPLEYSSFGTTGFSTDKNNDYAYDYISYPLDSTINLSDYELDYLVIPYTIVLDDISTSGWEFSVPVSFEGATKEYNINKIVTVDNKQVYVEKLELSPISSTIYVKNNGVAFNGHSRKNFNLKLQTDKMLGYNEQHSIIFNNNSIRLVRTYQRIIDPKEMKSFIIGDLEIPLN